MEKFLSLRWPNEFLQSFNFKFMQLNSVLIEKNLLFFFHSIPEPTPSTMTALHQFGAEMLKLSRGLDAVSSIVVPIPASSSATCVSAVAVENTTTEHKIQQKPLLSSRDLPPPPPPPPPPSSKLNRERNR